MEQWAAYLDKLKAGAEVIPLHGHVARRFGATGPRALRHPEKRRAAYRQ